MSEQTLLEAAYPAMAPALREIRTAVRCALSRVACETSTRDDLVLAIDEACQNVIRHGYGGKPGGQLRVSLVLAEERVVVSISDDAPASPPDLLDRGRPLHALRPGGLGTHFMRALMDEVTLLPQPSGRGNRLRMVKRLAGQAD